MGALLLLGIRLKYVAAYAAIWIMGVMAVIGLKDTGDFLEHFGPLAMAIFLVINARPINKK